MATTIIRCAHVQMGYGREVILPDVELEIARGAVLGIVGPNGAGKTTLLKTLLGILRPVSGQVTFPMGREAVRFGYVPQRQVVDETYPLTVEEVVMMGRYGSCTRPASGRRGPAGSDAGAGRGGAAAVGWALLPRALRRAETTRAHRPRAGR